MTTPATRDKKWLGRSIWPAIALACLLLGPGRATALDDIVGDGAALVAPDAQGNMVFANVNGIFVANVANNNNATIIDQWLFPRGQAQADAKRQAFETPLAMQLNELRRSCNLSEAQNKKMALAMECDVIRFFDDVEALRERYSQPNLPIDQKMQREIMPLQLKSQTGALCGPDSFFEKTLPRVLDEEQSIQYRAVVQERLRRRYLAMVEVALAHLEERIPLDSRQHEAIRRLLVEGPLPRQLPFGSNTSVLVMYRLSRIPSEQLEPLFDEHRWTALNQDRQRFAGYREHLKLIGLLGDNEP